MNAPPPTGSNVNRLFPNGSLGIPVNSEDLNDDDVLLGRGAALNRFIGNIRFRDLVREKTPDYVKNGRRLMKDRIARDIVRHIQERNGRFLRKISDAQEASFFGLMGSNLDAWVLVDDEVALEKVKQAFRDEHNKPTKPQAGKATTKARKARKKSPPPPPAPPSMPETVNGALEPANVLPPPRSNAMLSNNMPPQMQGLPDALSLQQLLHHQQQQQALLNLQMLRQSQQQLTLLQSIGMQQQSLQQPNMMQAMNYGMPQQHQNAALLALMQQQQQLKRPLDLQQQLPPPRRRRLDE